MRGKLNDKFCKAAKPGRHTDGLGLHLYVKPPGKVGAPVRSSWVLRYQVGGKSRDMGLGSYPEVPLSEARDARDRARKLIRNGRDPLQERRQARVASAQAHTFRQLAEEYIATHKDGWVNEKHAAQWPSTLATYVYPVFGEWPVQTVDTDAVLKVLTPIWTIKAETARRVRQRVEILLEFAKVKRWREGDNPARFKGHLELQLPKQDAVNKHFAALPWQQVAAFVAELRKQSGTAARAIEFGLLTVARSGQLRAMKWSEIDWTAATWYAPHTQVKGRTEGHQVPLCAAALAVLEQLRQTGCQPAAYVFPGTKGGKPMSDMTLTAVLRRMNVVGDGKPVPWYDPIQRRPITMHGFRSTFRDWAAESTHHPREVVEAAMAHSERNKVVAAYLRTKHLERRRPLMVDWGEYCCADGDDTHQIDA